MTTTTPQQKIKALLEKAGIPYREIQVYGSQIVITSACRETANKWAGLVARFATVRKVLESVDYAKENKGTVLNPTVIRVWRTFATI